MSVTIYEIAEVAGVSTSTVSRALRGSKKELRPRSAARAADIRRIAAEMGYRPNIRARGFSQKRSFGIGLLYTDDAWIFEGMNHEVVSSLVRTLQQSGYHLMFVPIDETDCWEEIALGGQIDGAVVFQRLPASVSETLNETQMPVVLLGDNSDSSLSQVIVNDLSGAYAATKHLIGLGHERIMFHVHESVKPHCSINERLCGYRAAMTAAGYETIECVHKPIADAIHEIVRGERRPTGVIAYCNYEATLLVHAMWQYGIRIPMELSIIGFNDVFAARHMTPPLTTVGYDAARLGELGAQLVLLEIESEAEDREPTVLEIRPNLVVRGSTGPAPGESRNGHQIDMKPVVLDTESTKDRAG